MFPNLSAQTSHFMHMLSMTCLLLSSTGLVAAPLSPIPLGTNQLQIEENNFRFSVFDPEGKVIAPAHHGAGASLNGSALSVISKIDQHSFQLVSKNGERAKLIIKHDMGCTAVTISPDQPATPNKPHKIALQLGGMPVAYGLGDTGGWNQTLNLVNEEETTYKTKTRWRQAPLAEFLHHLPK